MYATQDDLAFLAPLERILTVGSREERAQAVEAIRREERTDEELSYLNVVLAYVQQHPPRFARVWDRASDQEIRVYTHFEEKLPGERLFYTESGDEIYGEELEAKKEKK